MKFRNMRFWTALFLFVACLAFSACTTKENVDTTAGQESVADNNSSTDLTEDKTINEELTVTETPVSTSTATPTKKPTNTPTKKPTNTPTPKSEPFKAENTPEPTKMAMVEVDKDIEWQDLMYDMGAGWNLGNTLDAKNVNTRNELSYEGAWITGGKTTLEMIQTIKAAGFKTIRVPVSWHNHVDEVKGDDGHYYFTIHEVWLNRVQEVVDYCYNEGLYVIINIHHDDYTEYYVYPDAAHAERSFDYMRSIWSQLAERFGDYDYHLIFETMNEVRLKGNSEWNPTAKDALTAQTYINEFNRIAVETIRTTPGKYNLSRYIGCPGYVSSIDSITSTYVLPFDPSPYENRIMVPIHAYVNWSFVSAETKTFTSGVKSEITTQFNKMSKRLTEKDIPCYIGEWGVTLGKDNVDARSAYVTHYLEKAATSCKDSQGNIVRIPCILWDNTAYGGEKAASEKFGFFDRANLKFHEEEYMELIIEATYKDYSK